MRSARLTTRMRFSVCLSLVLLSGFLVPEHSSVFRMPGGDALLPLLPRQIVLIHDSEMDQQKKI